MGHEHLVKVQLRKGVSFAYLDKTLNERLKEVLDCSRVEFIEEQAKSQFGFEFSDYESVKAFTKLIKKNGYKDTADWLREIARAKIDSTDVHKNTSKHCNGVKENISVSWGEKYKGLYLYAVEGVEVQSEHIIASEDDIIEVRLKHRDAVVRRLNWIEDSIQISIRKSKFLIDFNTESDECFYGYDPIVSVPWFIYFELEMTEEKIGSSSEIVLR